MDWAGAGAMGVRTWSGQMRQSRQAERQTKTTTLSASTAKTEKKRGRPQYPVESRESPAKKKWTTTDSPTFRTGVGAFIA